MKCKIQTGVEVVNPGIEIVKKVNNVTGGLRSLWTKSTVHGTNRGLFTQTLVRIIVLSLS